MEERLFELGRRTFDTPGFRGLEFIEVEAKTVINHVPGNAMPFAWTINPYRGCSHACTYCMLGETRVLMADGRTKPLSDVKVGDRVYGTARQGSYRRYVTTEVLAHWATVKPAYRTTLEDGTELITSGDHRFLSNRGWKYVTGSEQGRDCRAHLTTSNKLMGSGKFAPPPLDSTDYREGYLCGMIRGDGHLGSYSYERPGRGRSQVHRFRLALVDIEALQRTRHYLDDLHVATQEFLFQAAAPGTKRVMAIRTSARARVGAIRELIRWPGSPSTDWTRGFLAGIFDAEGSYSRGILRMSNSDPDIIRWIASCLRAFRFAFTVEPARQNGVRSIRLLGGLREHLRFFHTFDPTITRKRTIEGTAIKSDVPLRVLSVEPLGIDLLMYDITTGTGDFIANGVVSHNCFARPTHTYMDMGPGRDFETKIIVKVNAVEVLRSQLRARRWKGEHIAMGTATDPYQRAEGKYRLMPGIIRTLVEHKNPFSILTKGTLILRDLETLVEAARSVGAHTALSIPTLDTDVWRATEPGTPHPRKRMEAVARLNAAGVPCGVMMMPILPGISDDSRQLRATAKAAAEAGATFVTTGLLHLRPVVREVFLEWLGDARPDLVERYERMYVRSYAPQAAHRALGAAMAPIREECGLPAPHEPPPFRFSSQMVAEPTRRGPEQLPLLM